MKIIDKILIYFGLKKEYELEDVFTPTKAAKINYVNRDEIEQNVRRAIKIPGTQLILYGHSGGGKTTIIRKVLDELNRKYIITNCVNGITVNEIIINAFDKLNVYYTSERNSKHTAKISTNLKASYKSISSSLSSEITTENTEKEIRVLPVQLTFEKLGEFLGAAECVWIIEDFHKVKEDEKGKLSDIMKAFVDIANDYSKTKIVAIGAVATAREVVNYSPDINVRVAEIPIPLLTNNELEKIIKNGAKLLNIKFENQLINKTVHYSNSLGSLCHQLCYSHCEQSSVERTCMNKKNIEYNVLKKSIEYYVSQKSDTFQQTLDKALKQRKAKFENVKIILKSFIEIGKESITYNELLSKIKETYTDYPQSNLTVYLKPLTTSKFNEIIRYDENSGKYSFSDPFFKAFCAMSLDEIEQEDKKEISINIDDLITHFEKLINNKYNE